MNFKQKLNILFIFIGPLVACAQTDGIDQGIKFENGRTWDQIKAEAKKENRYIFVDCFTTWCAPCKRMEKDIYPLEKVGDFFNKYFISVKVQMDQTNHDDAQVKAWYSTSKFMEAEYKVNAYPTFIFFSPDGKIVHRAAGGFPESQFILLAKNSLDPEKQYYTVLSNYKSEQMDTAKLKALALEYRFSGPELAGMALKDYFRKLGGKEKWDSGNLKFLRNCSGLVEARQIAVTHINSLKIDEMYTRENIHLISTFTQNVSDPGFKAFYENPDKADSAMGQQRFARNMVVFLIQKSILDPVVGKAKTEGKTPDWGALMKRLNKQYGEQYSLSAVLQAKRTWFGSQNDSVNSRKTIVEYLEKFKGWEDDFNLNNYAWYFFQKVDDRFQLQAALEWSREAILINPNYNWFDTYANLLYKLGNKDHAIRWEEIAAKLEPKARDVQDNLKKMKQGKPTWPFSR